MFMNMKKSHLVWIIVASLLVGGLVSYGTTSLFRGQEVHPAVGGEVTLSKEEYEQLQYMNDKYAKAEELWQYVSENYYIDVSDEDLANGMYKGIFAGTGDIYSEYMTKEEYAQWETSMEGEFEGVGVTFEQQESGEYVVISTVKGSPAEKGGLKPGDILTKVDGEEYETSTQMSMAIRGESGTDVKITYVRDGKEAEVTLTRAKIVMATVESEIRDDNIGYIKISSFENKTAADFEEALRQMESKAVKGLIIDLRDNGGGLVDQSVKIADMLLGEGTVIYTEDRQGDKETYTSDKDRTSLPYVVLVNENTASASEILAAAIQDNSGGKIVGTVTFGKGIIQVSHQRSDGSGVKLTVMQYFSPKGNKIHGVGVTPDVEVEGEEGQLKKAVELLK